MGPVKLIGFQISYQTCFACTFYYICSVSSDTLKKSPSSKFIFILGPEIPYTGPAKKDIRKETGKEGRKEGRKKGGEERNEVFVLYFCSHFICRFWISYNVMKNNVITARSVFIPCFRIWASKRNILGSFESGL